MIASAGKGGHERKVRREITKGKHVGKRQTTVQGDKIGNINEKGVVLSRDGGRLQVKVCSGER